MNSEARLSGVRSEGMLLLPPPPRRADGMVYVSGFRVVQEVNLRHAEYRVVISGWFENWIRYSEVKAIAAHHALLSSPKVAAAWDAVRACKAPRGRALDPENLSRKCVAIEAFLRILLDELKSAKFLNLDVAHKRRPHALKCASALCQPGRISRGLLHR